MISLSQNDQSMGSDSNFSMVYKETDVYIARDKDWN